MLTLSDFIKPDMPILSYTNVNNASNLTFYTKVGHTEILRELIRHH